MPRIGFKLMFQTMHVANFMTFHTCATRDDQDSGRSQSFLSPNKLADIIYCVLIDSNEHINMLLWDFHL